MNASIRSLLFSSEYLAAMVTATIEAAAADGRDIGASEAWDALVTISGDPLLTVIGQHATDLDSVENEIHETTLRLVKVAQEIHHAVRRGEHLGPVDGVSTTARELDRLYLRREWLAGSLRSAVGMWNASNPAVTS